MSDNTLQYEWIVTIQGNLDAIVADFVAGNLLWYAVEGAPKIRAAPDVLVALGRPKGYRGSYKTWCEDGVVPTVVFEVLSPGNRLPEMIRKQRFYDQHGVSEYYVLDPDEGWWCGWIREGERFADIVEMHGFVSPALGIRFEHDEKPRLFRPDGSPFLTFVETQERMQQQQQRLVEQDQTVARQHDEIQRLREALRAAGIEQD